MPFSCLFPTPRRVEDVRSRRLGLDKRPQEEIDEWSDDQLNHGEKFVDMRRVHSAQQSESATPLAWDVAWSEDDQLKIEVHADSDWLKSLEHNSTSEGMMMINGKVTKHWSRTQASCAFECGRVAVLRRCHGVS